MEDSFACVKTHRGDVLVSRKLLSPASEDHSLVDQDRLDDGHSQVQYSQLSASNSRQGTIQPEALGQAKYCPTISVMNCDEENITNSTIWSSTYAETAFMERLSSGQFVANHSYFTTLPPPMFNYDECTNDQYFEHVTENSAEDAKIDIEISENEILSSKLMGEGKSQCCGDNVNVSAAQTNFDPQGPFGSSFPHCAMHTCFPVIDTDFSKRPESNPDLPMRKPANSEESRRTVVCERHVAAESQAAGKSHTEAAPHRQSHGRLSRIHTAYTADHKTIKKSPVHQRLQRIRGNLLSLEYRERMQTKEQLEAIRELMVHKETQ